VPVISVFFGILIRIHFRDHNPPHFHAEYQGYQAYFGIEDGKIIEGEFPPKLTSIVRDWANEHRAELEMDWNLAQQRQPLNRIPGADQ
jgi:hypothetical protein